MTTDRFYHLTCECKYEFMYDTVGEDYPECPACGCFLHRLKTPKVKAEKVSWWARFRALKFATAINYFKGR